MGPGRLVGIMYVCWGVIAITANPFATSSMGTSLCHRSDRLFAKMRIESRFFSGMSSRSGCSTTPVVAPGSLPLKRRPATRNGIVRGR